MDTGLLKKGDYRAPSHTREVFDPERRKRLVGDLLYALRKLRRATGFNAIAASGHSGLVLGSILSFKLDVPLLAVRRSAKESDNDGSALNGYYYYDEPLKYVVVDDLIASGATMARIFRTIADEVPEEAYGGYAGTIRKKIPRPIPVGVLLYGDTPRSDLDAPVRTLGGRWHGRYSVPVWSVDGRTVEGYGGPRNGKLMNSQLFRHLARKQKRA